MSFEHGHTVGGKRSPTFRSWEGIIRRCGDPKSINWKYYGGRGISVCKRWLKFSNFLADMGLRPEGKSIDRIDNDGNYGPRNCQWADLKQQNRNRRWLISKRNTSGCVGVYYDKTNKRWVAQLRAKGYGNYILKEDAIAARKAAERGIRIVKQSKLRTGEVTACEHCTESK